MGLAPYGRPEYLDAFRKIVRVQADGTFELDLDYFVHHAAGASMTFDEGSPEIGTMYSEKFVETFGEARRAGRAADRAAPGRRRLASGDARRGGVRARPAAAAGHRAVRAVHGGRRRAQQRVQRQDPPEHAVHGHLHPAGRERRRDRARRVLLHLPPRARPPAALRDDRRLHRAAVPRPTRSRRRSTAGDSRINDSTAAPSRSAPPRSSPGATCSGGFRAGWSGARGRSGTAASSRIPAAPT